MAGVKGSGHYAEGMSIIHLERDHDRCSSRPRPNVPQSSHPSPPTPNSQTSMASSCKSLGAQPTTYVLPAENKVRITLFYSTKSCIRSPGGSGARPETGRKE